jgi:AcrR family transcriptional regulator
MSSDTRDRLLQGAIDALRTQGIAGVSARTIAAAAGVNQALVFYHFGSVDELVAAAAMWSAEREVADYRERFERVRSLRELQKIGREMNVRGLGPAERAASNVTVLGQMLAGAQTNPALAAATRDALALWTAEIERVLNRVLADSPLGEVADVPGLARAVSASFIGMELLAAVDPDGDRAAFRALDQLGALLEYLDDLGPAARVAARRAVRTAVRRSVRA